VYHYLQGMRCALQGLSEDARKEFERLGKYGNAEVSQREVEFRRQYLDGAKNGDDIQLKRLSLLLSPDTEE